MKCAQCLSSVRQQLRGQRVNIKPTDRRTLTLFAYPRHTRKFRKDKITDKNLTGSGNYSKGTVGFINGIRIIETNYLPSENITTANAPGQTTGSNTAKNVYTGDFTNTVGLVMQKGAIGTITRKGLTVECTWLPQELTWLLTARNLQGHGILDPRRAVEIRDEAEAGG